MKKTMLPVGTHVLVSPENAVRGPEYRAVVRGYNQSRTKYHLGAQIAVGVYAKGGSWAFPDEVDPR